MKPEKEKLMDDLLDAQSRREATLQAGGRILRRHRHWRVARQTIAVLAIVLIAGIFLNQRYHPQKAATVPVSVAVNKTAPVQSGVLTDAQLLALFPNTPVALATLHNGKKMIIFPRPADEARYVVHI